MSRGIFVVGCGAVGPSLGRALARAGHRAVGLHDADRARAEAAGAALGAPAFHGDLPAEIGEAGTVLICVPDRSIGEVARDGAALASPDQVWLHTSGRHGAGVLEDLAGRCAGAGSCHPALVFPPGAVTEIPPGTRFAVDGDRAAVDRASALARDVGGVPMRVGEEARAAYHAATAMASNCVVALLADAQSALGLAGIAAGEGEPLLVALAKSALDAASDLGLGGSLSGPVRRGDAETVRSHMEALADLPEVRDLYRAAGLAALRLARGSPGLTDAAIAAVESALLGRRR